MSASFSIRRNRAEYDLQRKPFALWLREWDGIDKPEYTLVAQLSSDMAQLLVKETNIPAKDDVDFVKQKIEAQIVEKRKELEALEARLRRAAL